MILKLSMANDIDSLQSGRSPGSREEQKTIAQQLEKETARKMYLNRRATEQTTLRELPSSRTTKPEQEEARSEEEESSQSFVENEDQSNVSQGQERSVASSFQQKLQMARQVASKEVKTEMSVAAEATAKAASRAAVMAVRGAALAVINAVGAVIGFIAGFGWPVLLGILIVIVLGFLISDPVSASKLGVCFIVEALGFSC